MERSFFYTGLLIRAVVPEIPEIIMKELERTQFVHEEDSRILRDLAVQQKDQ